MMLQHHAGRGTNKKVAAAAPISRGGSLVAWMLRSSRRRRRQQRIINEKQKAVMGASLISTTNNSAAATVSSILLPNANHHRNFQHLLAPAGLLGGTAMVYSHVLSSSKSTYNNISPVTAALYMILLAFHYAVQPILSKLYLSSNNDKTSTVTTALTEEVTKSVLAVTLFVTCNSARARHQQLLTSPNVLFQQSLGTAAVPAVLYAVQGVLQYHSHQHLDAVSYNGLTQTKTLSTALFCYMILGQRYSVTQVVALMILFVSALLFQKKPSFIIDCDSTNTTAIRLWRGVVPCVVATLMSGLAGALSQKGLRQAVATSITIDPFLYAFQVSAYSALVLGVQQFIHHRSLLFRRIQTMVFRGNCNTNKMTTTTENTPATTISQEHHDDGNWDWKVMIPILCKAVGGILTVMVHKHTGAVSKGFALVFGLVLAAVLESRNNKTMTGHQIVGTALVVLAGWLHLTGGNSMTK